MTKYPWEEYSAHVIAELERLDKCHMEQTTKIHQLDKLVEVLRVKAAGIAVAGTLLMNVGFYVLKEWIGKGS